MKLSKGQRDLLIANMTTGGRIVPPRFKAANGKETGIVRELAERGWFASLWIDGIEYWQITRNGQIAAVEAARLPEPGKWHGRKS